MELSSRTLTATRGPYQLYAEMTAGTGVPLVLMHGFPDNIHLYDRLLPHLAGRRPVIRFDFLGWGSFGQATGLSVYGNEPGR
jgi:haloalkane dehalogenase